MYFQWDEAKARSNEQKHGVSFAEAAELFADDHSSCGVYVVSTRNDIDPSKHALAQAIIWLSRLRRNSHENRCRLRGQEPVVRIAQCG
ncbi:MAG: BrnT family toxin [Candidatus Accumulibacter sp.]|uniref:BrnT family toxin n=1 Tax=Accumulibacter sp. TaxID=2053492 RepID=UPI001A502480|nr:BrnT family toxin [Accumulibacter sp.]MBL8395406.1 BrnT family toxin [Accumulibacter sp.]